MPGTNPIWRRFKWLHDQWVSFAENPDARVLCWQLEDDEQRMIDGFLTIEEDDRVGELPDLFLRFGVPFDKEARYGFALRDELVRMSHELHADPEGELAALVPWYPPVLASRKSDLANLLDAAQQFHAHYQLPGLLAIFLEPSQIGDVAAFSRWLLAAAREAPAQVRFIVLDSCRAPGLGALCDGDPKRVVAQRAALDIPGALAETSREAGQLDTPGGMFRQLFLLFSTTLGKRDIAGAEQLATQALAITTAQGWHALSMPIHMSLAAVLGGEQRNSEAEARYVAAEAAASAGVEAGDASCAKLRVQARMARGGLLISAKEHERAAQLYVETVPMAQALGDPRMVIDCMRLASFSREQGGDLRAALRHGMEVTEFARGVDFETRSTSTLPFVGEAMKRLAKKSELRPQAERTGREIEELLREPRKPVAAKGEAKAADGSFAAARLTPIDPAK
jgi:hypothetical protein